MTLLFVPDSSRHIQSKLQYVIRLQNSFQQLGFQAKLATLGGLHPRYEMLSALPL